MGTYNVLSMSPLIIVLTLMCVSNHVVSGRYVEDIWSKNYSSVCKPDPNCTSPIYCVGKYENGSTTILHVIQTTPVFQDGTTFLKYRMKFSEAEILKNYADKMKNVAENIKQNATLLNETLKEFIEQNFVKNGDLYNATLDDFTDNPPILKKVTNDQLKTWLSDLNYIWKTLAKKMNPNLANEERMEKLRRSSYIYVPNTFVVAGGRFDEMYYWDSYWIIKGLLACGMHQTSKGVIENMIYLVKKYGYIPNGNRIYYQGRSQPPMLIQMVEAYYKATNNASIIKENLKILESEFQWWVINRGVNAKKNGKKYRFFHYNAVSCYPRAESYREDYELLVNYTGNDKEERKIKIYSGIRSAAESGWDFSSRHMVHPELAKNRTAGLEDMNPAQFIYVELNSIMYSNAKLLAEWKREFENVPKSEYDEWTKTLLDGIENVLWNDAAGVWLDYDTETEKSRNYFYASNFAPLWSKAYTDPSKVERAIDYLEKYKIIYDNMTSIYHGVPTTDSTMADSEQQWDFPNVWAPLQSFIIGGLKKSNNPKAEKLAYNLATSFLNSTYEAYLHDNHTMYEKYNAAGGKGGKGEYGCETGFGWTNGLVFELFEMWPCFKVHNITSCSNAVY